MDIRTRTTGEILDDAWRLVLADLAPLLALSGLFAAPAAIFALLLLTQQTPATFGARCILPALFALALPLTGLGSGACQALFRQRAEGKPVLLSGCLKDALRRGLDHAAARALVLLTAITGGLILLLPGLAVQIAGATAHTLLASGDAHWSAALRESARQSQRHAGKAAAVMLARYAMLFLATLNVHGFLHGVLWVGDRLAGLDLTVVIMTLSLANPVYDVALLLLAWLLLIPVAEASNYLLYVDARARYEGLDLWYRVRRLFPATDKGATVALALGAVVLLATPARAADERLDTVRAARKELAAITSAVKAAEPYRDGNPWSNRLREQAELLDQKGGRQRGRYRWLDPAITAFETANRAGALRILADIDQRLALTEESLAPPPEGSTPARTKDQIKALLPPDSSDDSVRRPRPTAKEPPRPTQPVRTDDPKTDGPRRGRQSQGIVAPRPDSGLGDTGWLILGGLLLAAVIVAFVQSRRHRQTPKPAAASNATAPGELSVEALLNASNRNAAENLWRHADELAQAGKFLDAVRALYIGVLALLHRADLIRLGRTRTNGEYVSQVRKHDDVYRPFRGLTGLFEIKWYGERDCQPADYETCRRLAEAVREGAHIKS